MLLWALVYNLCVCVHVNRVRLFACQSYLNEVVTTSLKKKRTSPQRTVSGHQQLEVKGSRRLWLPANDRSL